MFFLRYTAKDDTRTDTSWLLVLAARYCLAGLPLDDAVVGNRKYFLITSLSESSTGDDVRPDAYLI